MSDPSRWTLGDLGVWECERHSMALRVHNLDDAEQTTDDVDAPEDPETQWVWRVLRVDRFTEIEMESGGEATREQAMIAAEAAAGTWR
jgi:hypothetical protein